MPSVKFNKEMFEGFVGKKLTLDELKDRISFLGTDLEGIEGNIIDVEIFPNRPDMLSMQGFARAFSSFIGVKTGLRQYTAKESGDKVVIEDSVSEVRPFTACAIVKNLSFTDELIKEVIQMQEKLHITYGRNRQKAAIGIYPMEKIKFPITYKALLAQDIKFRPLESKKSMKADDILEKHPTGHDYGHLLEEYDMYPVFVDATDKILSMPPIVNSHETGKIDEKTKEIFIECSGHDFGALEKCLNMVVTAFADMGGEIFSLRLEYPEKVRITPNLSPKKMHLDIKYVNKLLGLDLKEAGIQKCLESMGYGYKEGKALVPCYRADILHQIDLAEDIAIAYGYENFVAEVPRVATIAQEDRLEKFKNIAIDVLIGLGLIQTNSFHLTSEKKQTQMMEAKVELVHLGNSISQDFHVLQAWLIPALVETFSSNKHYDYPQKIFTIAKVFKQNLKTETRVQEDFRLCVGLSDDKAGYTEIKQILDYLMRSFDCPYSIEDTDHPSFIPGRVGRVKADKKKIAYIGELSPKVLENWHIIMPVAVFELNISELFKIIEEKISKE